MATRSISGVPELITREVKLNGFRIHELQEIVNHSVAHGRRDFYKIGLITGSMTVCYGEKTVDINGTVLFFVNPNVPPFCGAATQKQDRLQASCAKLLRCA